MSSDFARMRRLGDPVVSVVIANYNYGHFLGTCIDSVLAQTRLPEEIIVLDDGSTDGSLSILEAYGGRVKVIATENGGQAAAMNRGFAASSGDLVLFLDADDALKPECIETVLLSWQDDLAVLTFGLELVDEVGRSLGIYEASLSARSGDNRPRLLATGTFAFPPTSGIVFSRWALGRALPMPEARWRISADCYLVRAAALLGRACALSQVLGEYRLHGSNNYARSIPGLRDTAKRRSDLSDIADALEDLAEAEGLMPSDDDGAQGLAVALRARADALRAEARGELPAPWPTVPRDLLLSRWPVHLPFGQTHDFTQDGVHRAAAVPSTDGLRHGALNAPRGVRFSVDPTRDDLIVTVELEASGADPSRSFHCNVQCGDEVVWSGMARSGTVITFPIRRSPWEPRRVVDLNLRSNEALAFRSILVRSQPEIGAAPRLPAGHLLPLSFDGFAGLNPDEWEETESGVAPVGARAALYFSTEAGREGDLVLGTGERTPEGHLRIMVGGHRVFAGTVQGRRRLVLSCPPTGRSGRSIETLDVAFLAYGNEGGRVELVEIGLLESARSAGDPPPLNPGELVDFTCAANGRAFLVDGWFLEPGEGARNDSAEAEIAFRVPQGTRPGVLCLTLRPLLPAASGVRQVVGLSLDGEMQTVLELAGPGDCKIEIPAIEADQPLRVGVHSIIVPEIPAEETPCLAPIELTHLTLDAAPADTSPGPSRVLSRRTPPLERIFEEIGARLASEETGSAEAEELVPLRVRLLGMIATGDAGVLLLIAANRHGLSRMVETNLRLRALALTAQEVESCRRIAGQADETAISRLRAALADMLTVPAFRSRHLSDPGDLPAPLYWRPEATLAYLSEPPALTSEEDQEAYSGWLRALYGALDRRIASEPETSAIFKMCAEGLSRLRSVRVIFGDGSLLPLLRLRSRAIERLLVKRGARLTWSPPERTSRPRVRVGVLVRDVLPNPEGWALLGMWAKLDRERFEPVLIRMTSGVGSLDVGDRFERELVLGGLPVERAVAAIRDLDLDVFVTGCYVFDFEIVSEILAHRLARVQVWHGAVCPSTGAFRSFDVALTNRATEPDNPQAQYSETLEWIDGPVQCAYDFAGVQADGAAHLRAEIGVADDALLLVSGAMAHKITDPLLDAWAEILAGAPAAVLVLYPFAENWSMAFAEASFLGRVSAALSRHGVKDDRVIVLPTQTPERVGALVGAADLYLDSFPYSGATTVCEALSRGTPVLTRAGGALRQLTGTSWVRAFGEEGFVADSVGDYVAKALELVNDPGRLREAACRLDDRLARGEPPHCATIPFGRDFGAALWRLAGSGTEPPVPVAEKTTRRPAPARRIIKFGVFASPRTGSMFLCHLLNLSPGVNCHFELFHDDMIQFRDGDVTDPDALAERNADPIGFLRQTFEAAQDDGWRAVGFKHFGYLSRAVTEEMVRDRDIRLIRLSRSNLLAQYSSERIAKMTDDWIRRKGTRRRSATITFDADDFEPWEAHQRRVTQTWSDLLARSGRQALFLDYTRVFHPDTRAELSAFLGFRVRDPEDVGLERQNDDDILGRFDNPETVRAYLQARGLTHWARGG